MDASLLLTAASVLSNAPLASLAAQASPVTADFPWLTLVVLLPAAAALVMPLLPAGDGSDPRAPRLLAFGVLLVDLLLMLWVFSRQFDPALSQQIGRAHV